MNKIFHKVVTEKVRLVPLDKIMYFFYMKHILLTVNVLLMHNNNKDYFGNNNLYLQ